MPAKTRDAIRPGGTLFPGGVLSGDARWLAFMSLMLLVLMLPVSSYVAALPFIQQEWGLGNARAGAVYSAYLAGYALSALVVVPLTDRLGPRRVLVWSALLSLLAHALFPLVAYDMTAAIVLRGVAGVGLVGIYMPGLRLIAERFSGAGRGTAMGLFVTAQYIANSGSVALTGALMGSMEWRHAYLAVSLAAFAGLPIALLVLRGRGGEIARAASGRLELTALKNPAVRYLILGYAIHALQLFAARVWLPAFLVAVLVARGSDGAQAAVTGATVGGLALTVGSVGPLMGGVLSDRIGRATAASAIMAVSGVCAWTIGWTFGLPMGVIVVLCVLLGWGVAADSAIYSTGLTEVSSASTLGSAMAMQASLGLVGGIAGPVLFGGILDLSPESVKWGIAFSSLGVLAIVAIAGLQRLRALPQSRLLAGGKG